MGKSLIFYQGKENQYMAQNIEDWLPNKQIVRNYKANPKGFFGFDKKRDLIIFIGADLEDFNE